MNYKDWIIAGTGTVGALFIMKSMARQNTLAPATYTYNITVNNITCKYWQYIESIPYNITLNNGESISVNITYNTAFYQSIDISDIRFHNISSTLEGYGKIYAYVNGIPSLPTIGMVAIKTPIYVGFPSYPDYGTVFTTIWDTDDVKGNGTYNYTYVYEGSTPLYIKSLELYIALKE